MTPTGAPAYPALQKLLTIDTAGFTFSGAPAGFQQFSGDALTIKGTVNGPPAQIANSDGGPVNITGGGGIVNDGTITGGLAGTDPTRTGGHGVALNNAPLGGVNNGTIIGGPGADIGGGNTNRGGAGVAYNGTTFTNNGSGIIRGGASSGTSGAESSGSGNGVQVGGLGPGILINHGTIRGDTTNATISATPNVRVGVWAAFGTAVISNTGPIEGGTGGRGIYADAPRLNVVNSGTIRAGAGQTAAIEFSASATSTNLLELHAGSNIVGDVVASGAGANDTLRLAGTADWAIDVAQYSNLDIFEKVDSSTWAVNGTTTAATPWQILGGTLAVASDGALGDPSGTLTFDGGALQTTASLEMTRQMDFVGDGVIRPDAGTSLTYSGLITGGGDLVMDGAGELMLAIPQTYAGDTFVNQGTLSAGAANVFSPRRSTT